MDQPAFIPSSPKRDQVIVHIEALVHTMLQDLDNERSLVIPLRTTWSPSSQDIPRNLNNYCFPGTSHSSSWRFTVVLRILDIIHEALVDGKIVSKRDVYYQDPDLFGSQKLVDRYVDNIALTFNVSVKDMNVFAEVKGLVAGPFLVRKEEPFWNDSIYTSPEGTPVPRSYQFQNLLISSSNCPHFLLLVEKRAIFHALSHSNFHTRNNCVLLTGQGYPDLATRAFLYYFNSHLAPSTPCYALVDFDPDGLCIYSVYTRGSQTGSNQADVVVPNVHLLGLRSEEAVSLLGTEMAIIDFQAGKGGTLTDIMNPSNAIELSYLSQHERQRAKGLLKRLRNQITSEEVDDAEQDYMRERWDWQGARFQACSRQQTEVLIRELQICLIVGYKVEIEILNNRAGGLEKWVLEKVEEQANRA